MGPSFICAVKGEENGGGGANRFAGEEGRHVLREEAEGSSFRQCTIRRNNQEGRDFADCGRGQAKRREIRRSFRGGGKGIFNSREMQRGVRIQLFGNQCN